MMADQHKQINVISPAPQTQHPNHQLRIQIQILFKQTIKKNVITRNRFEIIAQGDPFETTSTAENTPNSHQIDVGTVIIKPPHPIIVKGVKDYSELCTTLIELISVDNFM